jgi:uncharacterized protein (TIGR02145 family)
MKKSIMKMTGLVVIAVAFCILYMNCNDNGTSSGKQDDRANGFVRKFNRPTTGSGGGSGNNNCTSADLCKSAEMPDGKIWMTENLNVETTDSWCYGNSTANCDKYGRLYTWAAAKKACPSGWRLPDAADWSKLVNAAGGQVTAGKKLRSTSGWNGNGNGTNDFGFSALPGGARAPNGYFDEAGNGGHWWTATVYDSVYAYRRNMFRGNDYVDGSDLDKSFGVSVRCLKDE